MRSAWRFAGWLALMVLGGALGWAAIVGIAYIFTAVAR